MTFGCGKPAIEHAIWNLDPSLMVTLTRGSRKQGEPSMSSSNNLMKLNVNKQESTHFLTKDSYSKESFFIAYNNIILILPSSNSSGPSDPSSSSANC